MLNRCHPFLNNILNFVCTQNETSNPLDTATDILNSIKQHVEENTATPFGTFSVDSSEESIRVHYK